MTKTYPKIRPIDINDDYFMVREGLRLPLSTSVNFSKTKEEKELLKQYKLKFKKTQKL